MKRNYAILIFLIFFSCKNEQKLGNKYFYLPNYEAEDIGYPYGSVIYKSDAILNFDKLRVYADVLEVKSNEKLIIALQKPNVELFKEFVLSQMKAEFSDKSAQRTTIELLEDTISISSSQFYVSQIERKDFVDKVIGDNIAYKRFKNAKYIYYIIDKTTNKIDIYYNKNDFEKARQKRNLELKF